MLLPSSNPNSASHLPARPLACVAALSPADAASSACLVSPSDALARRLPVLQLAMSSPRCRSSTARSRSQPLPPDTIAEEEGSQSS